MKRLDNASAHPAAEYDRDIRKSIPHYDQFHQATINVVTSYGNNPTTWIDVGCGTGTFVERAYKAFPRTSFMLADPSAAMLDLAAQKLNGKDRVTILKPVTAEDNDVSEPVDVVSAIQALHYLSPEKRGLSVQNCYRLLRSGGIFITFENIRPLTDKGIEIGKRSWQQYEVRAGKTIEEATAHVERLGVEFFPITIEEHIGLLRGAKFAVVELLWYSYVQAGFYCIK